MAKNKVIKKKWSKQKILNNLPLHLMLLPAVIISIIFSYIPMAGIVIAFQRFVPSKGMFGNQTWVHFLQFKILFSDSGFWTALRNTVTIALGKIILGTIFAIGFALLLNEVKPKRFKKTVQTIVYFPYFISWVVFSGILVDILSPSTGVVNSFLQVFGIKPIYFIGDKSYFQGTMIVTDVLKTFGYNAVIYLATISGISPTLYEAAEIDGANRWQQTWHITLSGMRPIIALLLVLNLGGILNAGFDQIYSLLTTNVLDTGDILDTYIYRRGILSSPPNYSLAAAAGLLKSVVGLILIGSSYLIAYKAFNYRLF